MESNYPKRVIECQPIDESDLEEYIPKEENDAEMDGLPRRHADSWRPSCPSDPPSFKDAGLNHPEMLFVIDMDS